MWENNFQADISAFLKGFGGGGGFNLGGGEEEEQNKNEEEEGPLEHAATKEDFARSINDFTQNFFAKVRTKLFFISHKF